MGRNHTRVRRRPGKPIARPAAPAKEPGKRKGQRPLRHPATSQVDYTEEEAVFLKAVETYQRESRRPFPTYREILAVLRSLGYRLVAEAEPLPEFRRKGRD